MENKTQESTRSVEVINQEYNVTCAQIGDKTFRINMIQSEIISLGQKLVFLNEEMNKKMNETKPELSEVKQ